MTATIAALNPTMWLKLDDADTADGAVALNSGSGGYTGEAWAYRGSVTPLGAGLLPYSDGSVVLAASPVELLWSDNFNRADGPLGPSWTLISAPPDQYSGAMVVSGGRAVFIGGTNVNARSYQQVNPLVYAFPADIAVEAVFSVVVGVPAASASCAVGVRGSSDSNGVFVQGYFCRAREFYPYDVVRVINSASTSVLFSGPVAKRGDVMRLAITGWTLTLHINGVLVGSYTDPDQLSLLVGGQPFMVFTSVMSLSTDCYGLDNVAVYGVPRVKVAYSNKNGCDLAGATSRNGAGLFSVVFDAAQLAHDDTSYVLFSSRKANVLGFEVRARWHTDTHDTGMFIEVWADDEPGTPRLQFKTLTNTNFFLIAVWKDASYVRCGINHNGLNDFPPLGYILSSNTALNLNVHAVGNRSDASGPVFLGGVDEILYWKAGNTLTNADLVRIYRSLVVKYDLIVDPVDDEAYGVVLVLVALPPFVASCMALDSICWQTEFSSPDYACPAFQSLPWPTCFESWSQPVLVSKMPCAAPGNPLPNN